MTSHQVRELRERRLDLSVFAFVDPLGAFGLFAVFRPPECVMQPLGDGGASMTIRASSGTAIFSCSPTRPEPAASRLADLRGTLAAVAVRLRGSLRDPALGPVTIVGDRRGIGQPR